MGNQVLAVDIGATKVALALVDETMRVSEKFEIPVSNEKNLWAEIAHHSLEIRQQVEDNFLGVGIGSAGPLHLSTGSISPVNIPQWRNFGIVSAFRETLGTDVVVLHGDALAFTHAEHRLGAGRGVQNLLGMVVSTGIGGGLILNNSIFSGDSGNASFIGHHTINFDGIACTCGRFGCVETYASGPRMAEIAKTRGWKSNSYSFIELADDARSGNAIALEVINEGTRALAVGIVNTLATLDIRTVVLGGGVTQAGDIFWNPLRRHVEKEAQFTSFLQSIDLRSAELSRDAGIIGAALGVISKLGPLDQIPTLSTQRG
jgi:glucokinase